MVREHAEEAGYVCFGPVEVSLEEASDLDTGLFRIRSDVHSPPVPGICSTRRRREPARTSNMPVSTSSGYAAIELDGRRFRLQKASTTIGRAPDCDIQIDDPGISRAHARIDLAPLRWWWISAPPTAPGSTAAGSKRRHSTTAPHWRSGRRTSSSGSGRGRTRCPTSRCSWSRSGISSCSGCSSSRSRRSCDVISSLAVGSPAQQLPWPHLAKAGKPGKTPRGAPRTLHVTSGALSGTTIPLADQPITLGRASDNTIVLNDDYASNYHARLRPYEGRWLVEDLGSTNGTYLDKQKVTSPSVVPIGVPVKVGKTLLELRK